MLDYLWGFMLVLGVVWGLLNGRAEALTEGVLSGAKEAVSMSITMLGIMSAWTGVMQIAEKSGIIESISAKLKPFMKFMFPKIESGTPAYGHICTNIVANVLGLGWAATPAGLKAMKALSELEKQRGNVEYIDEGQSGAAAGADSLKAGQAGAAAGNRSPKTKKKMNAAGMYGKRTATNEMCTFLVLNISSLQLIPVNIIAYRSQYGSVSPAKIIVPAIIATSISTLAAIIFCRIMSGRERR